MVRSTAAVILLTLCASAPAFASDSADDKGADAVAVRPVVLTPLPAIQRPAALPALYATLAGLQMYDGYSTMQGRSAGAREANPMMNWMTASPARFWTVKAATTAASIAIAERLWKRNKVGAIVTMAVANTVSAAVAAHNASVLRQIR